MTASDAHDAGSGRSQPPGRDEGLWAANGWWGRRFELVRGGAKGNLVPMEGLRGVAVFLVFLVHFFTLLEPQLAGLGVDGRAFLAGVRNVGHTGVDLFFVLSGYLIYGTLISREQGYFQFMLRRVRRIYPAFLAIYAVYVVLALSVPGQGRIPPGQFDAVVYLIQNLLLLPGLWPVQPLVAVAWSLSYEMFFYLVTPLLVVGLGLRARSAEARIALLLLLTIALAAYCAAYGGHVRLVMFIAGAALFECMTRWPLRSVRPDWAVAGVVAAGLISALRADGSLAYAWRTLALFAAYGMLCSAAFGRPGSFLARSLSWTPLRWLGNMSYSYYLIHGLALSAGFAAAEHMFGPYTLSTPVGLLLGVPAFVCTLLPSIVLFLLVERPFSLGRH